MYLEQRIPASFDFCLEFPGELEIVELSSSPYGGSWDIVFRGVANPVATTPICGIATGDAIPENATKYVKTLVWSEGGSRRVVHLFALSDRLPGRGSNNYVWHQIVTEGKAFIPTGNIVEFLHTQEYRGDLHVWYKTNAEPNNNAYVVTTASKGQWVVSFQPTTAPSKPSASPSKPSASPATTSTKASATPVPGVPGGNGVVFNYRKKNGDVRLVRLSYTQFHNSGGVQRITGYDHDRKELRTFILANIIDFPPVV